MAAAAHLEPNFQAANSVKKNFSMNNDSAASPQEVKHSNQADSASASKISSSENTNKSNSSFQRNVIDSNSIRRNNSGAELDGSQKIFRSDPAALKVSSPTPIVNFDETGITKSNATRIQSKPGNSFRAPQNATDSAGETPVAEASGSAEAGSAGVAQKKKHQKQEQRRQHVLTSAGL